MEDLTIVAELLRLAKEYDASALITLVTLVVIFMLKRLGTIKKMIAPLLAKEESHESLPCAVRKAYVVQLLLNDLRESIRCDRITVIQFGNGEFLYGNIPAQKATVTFESLGRAVGSIRDRFHEVPLSLFPSWAYALFKTSFYASPKTDDDELAALLDDFGDKSFYLAALDDQDGNIFGAVAVHYCRHQHKLTADEKAQMIKETNKIAGVMLCSMYHNDERAATVCQKHGPGCDGECSAGKRDGISIIDLIRQLTDDDDKKEPPDGADKKND